MYTAAQRDIFVVIETSVLPVVMSDKSAGFSLVPGGAFGSPGRDSTRSEFCMWVISCVLIVNIDDFLPIPLEKDGRGRDLSQDASKRVACPASLRGNLGAMLLLPPYVEIDNACFIPTASSCSSQDYTTSGAGRLYQAARVACLLSSV